MDKTWMRADRLGPEYKNGVKRFMNFAKEHTHPGVEIIRCPCENCNNGVFKTLEEVIRDLMWKGFAPGYVEWICHGEGFGVQANPNAREVDRDATEVDRDAAEVNDTYMEERDFSYGDR